MDITKVADKNKINEAQISSAQGANQSAKARGLKEAQAENTKLRGSSEISTGNEKVEWSENASLAMEAMNEVKASPDVRADRVAELKAAVKNGTYKIDADKVAERMIQSSIEEALFTKKA